MIAYSVSFLWFKRIYLGKEFLKLSLPQRKAVMAHEFAHLRGHHTELRFLCLLLFFPMYGWVCRKLEFKADQTVKKAGLANELMDVLKSEFPGNWRYPSNSDRRRKLLENPTLRGNRLTGVTGKETYP
jgi:hypothetical protein